MNRTGRTYYKSDENRNGIILLLFNSLYRNYKTKDNYADSRKHRNKEDIINSNVITSESKEGNKEGNCYNYSNDEGNFCFLSIIKLVKEEHQKHHTCRQTRSCERTLQVVIDDCVFRTHIEEVKNDKEETAYKIQEGCVWSVHAVLEEGIEHDEGTQNADTQKDFLIENIFDVIHKVALGVIIEGSKNVFCIWTRSVNSQGNINFSIFDTVWWN